MSEPNQKKVFQPIPESNRIRVTLFTRPLDHNPSAEMEGIKELLEKMLDESKHFEETFVREIMVVKR